MALPAFLVPDWRTGQQGLAASGKVAERTNSRRVGRPDRGWVREATTVQVAKGEQEQRA
jgi:hypothetical protein